MPFKKVPIVALLPFECSDLEGDFASINEMHSDALRRMKGAVISKLADSFVPLSRSYICFALKDSIKFS